MKNVVECPREFIAYFNALETTLLLLQKIPQRNVVINGGCDSKRGAIPWQVILEEMNCVLLCGGTQINLRFILTAAHCIDTFKKDASESCPLKIKKKKRIFRYPHNINSKYVLYFCCYTGEKSTYHNHIYRQQLIFVSPFFSCSL